MCDHVPEPRRALRWFSIPLRIAPTGCVVNNQAFRTQRSAQASTKLEQRHNGVAHPYGDPEGEPRQDFHGQPQWTRAIDEPPAQKSRDAVVQEPLATLTPNPAIGLQQRKTQSFGIAGYVRLLGSQSTVPLLSQDFTQAHE
jgi:hypothetical protein